MSPAGQLGYTLATMKAGLMCLESTPGAEKPVIIVESETSGPIVSAPNSAPSPGGTEFTQRFRLPPNENPITCNP